MAKQIKAIKCPHCGSVDKTKLEKDLYHCENCNTDYFLDNDDININVNHQTSSNNKFDLSNVSTHKKISIGLSGVIILLFVGMMINSTFNKPAPQKYGTYSGSSSTVTTTSTPKPKPPKVEKKPLSYTSNSHVFYTYFTTENKPNSFDITYRSFWNKADLSGVYYEIRDVLTGQILKRERLLSSNDGEWDFRRFDNGMTYIVYNKSQVFLFDEKNQTVTDVTKVLFANNPEFNSGIAVVNLAAWGYEDCFYVLTNNGKEYYFYPLLNKIYDTRADNDAVRKHLDQLDKKRTRVDEAYVRTSYFFKNFNRDDTMLIKVVYNTKNIDAHDKFGITQVVNSDKPYRIGFQPGEGPLIEDKQLAVGRVFFSPKVVYGTKDQLIILAKNSAATNATLNMQSLDTQTGDIKWSVNVSEMSNYGYFAIQDKHNLSSWSVLIPYGKNKYIVQYKPGRYTLVSEDGTATEITYKPEEIFANTDN